MVQSEVVDAFRTEASKSGGHMRASSMAFRGQILMAVGFDGSRARPTLGERREGFTVKVLDRPGTAEACQKSVGSWAPEPAKQETSNSLHLL